MLLKFFKNVERESTIYTNHVQLFDPRINKFWSENFVTKDFFDLIKEIFTKENIKNNPSLICNLNHHYHPCHQGDFVDKFLDLVPEDKLWIFNYFQYEGVMGNATYFFINKPQARLITLNDTIFACRFDDQYTEIDARLGTEEFKEKFTEIITPIIERIETLLTTHGHKTYHNQNFISTGSLARYLWLMASNRPYSLSTGGEAIHASHIARMGDDVTIIVRIPNEYNVNNLHISHNARLSKTNKTGLHQVFSYSTNPMELLPHPITFKNEHNPVLYGVELECSSDYSVSKIIDATDEPFMIAKQDSSISGSKRFRYELVTVPMSFKAHKREWAKWFSKLDYDKFDTSKDTNNGMHVHIGKKHFDNDKHIRNLAWFINNPANREFMVALSERTEQSMSTYAPTRNYQANASKVRSMKSVVQDIHSMRGACNPGSGKNTVEIRLFRGIVSYAAVLKNLECVDAMFNFTREYPVYKMTLRTFISWLEHQPYNKYPVFKKFVFGLKDLKKILTASDMYEVIFTTTDADKISSKMKTAGMKITNEHVTILNKRLKKRTFILNKTTGALDVVYTNKFPLAHMDRELEKRYVNL